MPRETEHVGYSCLVFYIFICISSLCIYICISMDFMPLKISIYIPQNDILYYPFHIESSARLKTQRPCCPRRWFFCWTEIWKRKATKFPTHFKYHFNWQKSYENMGMDQYLLIPFLVGWTPIYQLFWCSPGVLLVLTHCHIWNGGDFTWFHQASQVNQPWCSGASFGSIFNGMNPLQTWEREENSW